MNVTACHRRADKQAGFSLVELLIVVGILTIIFSIAIPHYLSTREAAQAASAKADLKTVHSAQVSYFSGAGSGTYGTLAQLEAYKLIPAGFSSSAQTYTRFNYTGTLTLLNTNSEFNIVCVPPVINSNTPSYFLDDSGSVRFSSTGTATATSTPIGQQ